MNIDATIAELQALKKQQEAGPNADVIRKLEDEAYQATARMNNAIHERDKAVAALLKLRSDVHWTMQALKIKDLFRAGGPDAIAVPTLHEDYVAPEIPNDRAEDSERIEFINKHARVGLGQSHLIVSIDFNFTGQETIPEVYNIRHWVDLCRIAGGHIKKPLEEEIEL